MARAERAREREAPRGQRRGVVCGRQQAGAVCGGDAVCGSDLEVVSNAVVGVSLPLGPLEFQIPVWTAEAAEGTQPWEAWMFKLDLRSLNPLSLVRQNLQ